MCFKDTRRGCVPASKEAMGLLEEVTELQTDLCCIVVVENRHCRLMMQQMGQRRCAEITLPVVLKDNLSSLS